jgi:hypothetical protein
MSSTRTATIDMSAVETESKRALLRALIASRIQATDTETMNKFITSVLDGDLAVDLIQVSDRGIVDTFRRMYPLSIPTGTLKDPGQGIDAANVVPVPKKPEKNGK